MPTGCLRTQSGDEHAMAVTFSDEAAICEILEGLFATGCRLTVALNRAHDRKV